MGSNMNALFYRMKLNNYKVLGATTVSRYYAVGAVLSQYDDKKQEKVIVYASKTMSKSERLFPTCEKEALALIFGIKHFYPLLIRYKVLCFNVRSFTPDLFIE